MQLVCLVSQDDIPVVHQSSSPADRGDSRVISNQRQGLPAKARTIDASPNRKGHISVLVDLDVIDSVIVGWVWAHAAPTDGGWVAAWRPADALRGGGVGTHHRATKLLVAGGQHGSGRREKRESVGKVREAGQQTQAAKNKGFIFSDLHSNPKQLKNFWCVWKVGPKGWLSKVPPVSHQAALIVQSKDCLGGYPALIICSIYFF